MAKKKKLTRIERAELKLIDAIGPALDHPVIKTSCAVAAVADEPPLLALSGVTVAAGLLRGDPRLARAGARMLAAEAAAIALKTVGKDNIDRTRPAERIDKGRYKAKPGKSKAGPERSFPSGHAAGAIAVARAAGREFPEYRGRMLAAAAVISALQIPRRAHYPSDVLAGAVLGFLAELLVDRGFRLLRA